MTFKDGVSPLAKWSKVCDRFFAYAHVTVQGSSPTTANIGRPHSLWRAALGTGRSTLTRSVWADSARCMGIGEAALA